MSNRTKNNSQVCGDGNNVMKHRLGWSRRNLRASSVRNRLGNIFHNIHPQMMSGRLKQNIVETIHHETEASRRRGRWVHYQLAVKFLSLTTPANSRISGRPVMMTTLDNLRMQYSPLTRKRRVRIWVDKPSEKAACSDRQETCRYSHMHPLSGILRT